MAQTIGSLLIQIQADTARLNEQMQQVQGRLKKTDESARQLKNTLLSFASIYAVERLAASVADATTTFQGWQYTLEAGGLSAKQTSDELAFLQGNAEKLGISIKDTGSSFSRLILTGQAAGIPLKELNEDFSAATAAMRIFHLSQQQTTRSWLALTEIMSMGKVQSRQFTQQLGRDWPGIGALIAKTMYGGTDSLEKFQTAMKNGEISSRQFMDAFVKLMNTGSMKDALAGAEDSLQAAIGRLETSWFNFANQAQNAGLGNIVSGIDDLTKALNDPSVKQGFDAFIVGLMNIAKYTAMAVKGWAELANLIGQGMGVSVGADASTGLSHTLAMLKDLEKQDAQLRNALSDGDTFDELGISADKARAKLAAIENEMRLLQRSAAYERAHPNGDTSSIPSLEATDVIPKGTATNVERTDSAIQKLIKDLQFQNATIGMSKSQIMEYRIALGDLSQAFKDAPITEKVQMYNQLIQQGKTEISKQMASVKPMVANFKTATDQMSLYADQAARNIQSTLGDSLYAALSGKYDNIFQSFAQMLEKMIAQIMASHILDSVFGNGTQGSGQSAISNFFGAMFGAKTGTGKAVGGPVEPGTVYPVGEKGPELFMPTTAGTIIPNHALGGGGYHAHIHIDARGASGDTEAQLMALVPTIQRMIVGTMLQYQQRGTVPLV